MIISRALKSDDFFFFFSSRRRHTRSKRDWSSDVCFPISYSIGGTVSGLSGTLVLQNNLGDDLTLTANGSFTFTTRLNTGASYAVTVKNAPGNQTRSEERRVGKECRSRWSQYREKKKR